MDGVLQFTNGLTPGYRPALMVDSTDWLGVGEGSGGSAGYLPVDEFQLYNTVLSTAQIQKVYQNQALGFGSGLPANTQVQLASGATFDLNGSAQTIDSLANSAGGGGIVTTQRERPGDPHPGADRVDDLQRLHPEWRRAGVVGPQRLRAPRCSPAATPIAAARGSTTAPW